MKISVLPSVNVMYLRIGHKLIHVFYHKRRERMYWERSGTVSKLKNNFLQVTTSTTHIYSNYFLLQPENLYTV